VVERRDGRERVLRARERVDEVEVGHLVRGDELAVRRAVERPAQERGSVRRTRKDAPLAGL
jgi:hypothetical protein